ncbi:hypothetical protein [Anaerotignum sp.]
MSKNSRRYSDIIDLPHHQSVRKPHMSVYNRAAQFAPFAALVGYDQMVENTAAALLLDQRVMLSEDQNEILDEKLKVLQEHLTEMPQIHITYFDENSNELGGRYVSYYGIVKGVKYHPARLIMMDRKEILVSDISDIDGKIFEDNMDT